MSDPPLRQPADGAGTLPVRTTARFARHRRIVAIVAGIAACVTFARTIGLPLAYDDVSWHARLTGDGGTIPLVPHRILTFLSLRLEATLFDGWVPGYRLVSVLLHAIASGLVAWLSASMTRGAGVGLAAGLLFAVHPVHVEAVVQFSNVKDLLSGVFALSALILWRGSRSRPISYALSVLAFVLGLAAKEVAIAGLPVMLLLVDLLETPEPDGAGTDRRRPAWARTARAWPLIALVGLATVWALRDGGSPFGVERVRAVNELRMDGYPNVLANVLSNVPERLRLLVFPASLSVDYPVDPSRMPIHPASLAGIGIFAVWLGGAIWIALRHPTAGFAMAWVPVMALPASNALPLTHVYLADRYLYLPSVGVCLLLAIGWDRLRGRAGWGRVGSVLTVALLGVVVLAGARRSVVRIGDWRDEATLWQSARDAGYDTWRIQMSLGLTDRRAGRFAAAAEHFDRARSFPLRDDLRARRAILSDLVHTLYDAGRLDDAARGARELDVLAPDDALAPYVLGEWEWSRGRPEEALARYEAAVARDPDHAAAAGKLAWLLATSPDARLRDAPRAKVLAERALALDPDRSPTTVHALAAACAELGDFDTACRLTEEVIAASEALELDGLGRRAEASLALFRGEIPLSRARAPGE